MCVCDALVQVVLADHLSPEAIRCCRREVLDKRAIPIRSEREMGGAIGSKLDLGFEGMGLCEAFGSGPSTKCCRLLGLV
jgi:hypothetical protein